MMRDALQWPAFRAGMAWGATWPSGEGSAPPPSAWHEAPDGLACVTSGARVEALVKEAATWADRISCCVTAPQSQRGHAPWWRELLARSTKCERIYVRRPEQAEGWLLGRLHATGALRLVHGGGKQAASQLLVFARGHELRAVLAHIPLERAAAGAAFGALLSFKGNADDALARACEAQLDDWSERARTPTGSEVDALALDVRRREPLVDSTVTGSLRVVTDPRELGARLERLVASAASSRAKLTLRAFGEGHRLVLEAPAGGAAPFVLTLHAAPAWAAGNALLLAADGDESVLVWRGGLLGHSRARARLLWSEARLPALTLEDVGFGSPQRMAVIAHTGKPFGPQLDDFAREVARLGSAFGVEPPPALGHALAEFASLSEQQQTLLVWRALLGLGALEFGAAAVTAAEVLHDQGYLRGRGPRPDDAQYGAIAELLARAVESGRAFDRPSSGKLRAVQSEFSAYTLDDWLECLLGSLPEGAVVARRTALRLAYVRARECFGLGRERLRPQGRLERALDGALLHALERGLIVRVGATGLMRLGARAECPALESGSGNMPAEVRDGVLAGWARALSRLSPVQRCILARRTGWYGRSESLASVAERLGLTLENARQIEMDAWRRLGAESPWAAALATRLDRAFAGTRAIALAELSRDDAWWQGIERHPELVAVASENLPGAPVRHVQLGAGQRLLFFARFDQAELDAAFERALERAALIATPAPLDAFGELANEAVAALAPELAEYVRDALEARLELDPEDPTRVMHFRASSPAALEMLPIESKGASTEARLRLEDTLRSVFRAAGTPLSFGAVAERVRKRLDASDSALVERLAAAPFVHRNPDQYGLVSRDVPGGHDAIASLLNDVSEALHTSQRALTAEQIAALVPDRVKQAWSTELVRSVLASDPALHLAPAGNVTLRRWEHARSLPHVDPICPVLPARLRPRFERLAQAALRPSDELSRRLGAEVARLERASEVDPILTLPLVRQLSDAHERLLAHVAQQPESIQKLAQAALQCFLDALAPLDEDDLDAPPVAEERVREARAVLAALLRWLDLDWLGAAV